MVFKGIELLNLRGFLPNSHPFVSWLADAGCGSKIGWACLGWWLQPRPVRELCSGIGRTCVWCGAEQLRSWTADSGRTGVPLLRFRQSSSSSMSPVSSSFEILPSCSSAKAGLHNLSFVFRCALIKLQSFRGAGPSLGDVGPFFFSAIFPSLKHCLWIPSWRISWFFSRNFDVTCSKDFCLYLADDPVSATLFNRQGILPNIFQNPVDVLQGLVDDLFALIFAHAFRHDLGTSRVLAVRLSTTEKTRRDSDTL